jgi:hypothetical protein
MWRLYTYDVWGNAQDGYEVNDVYPKQTLEIDGDTDSQRQRRPLVRVTSMYTRERSTSHERLLFRL